MELTQATTFNLTFTFEKPAGNFKQLLLCFRNNEPTALRKNTLKCNITIRDAERPFSYQFENRPSELEFGNLYEFLIRTVGCEEEANTLCQVDSDPRPFEMGLSTLLRILPGF